jgi:hypothetical protein
MCYIVLHALQVPQVLPVLPVLPRYEPGQVEPSQSNDILRELTQAQVD